MILLRGVACHVSRDRRLSLQAVVERLLGSVEIDDPGVRVAGVLVLEHAGTVCSAADLAVDRVEPQLVADDPAAAHRIDVVDVDELGRRPQARVLQRLRVVAALQRAVRAAEVELAAERVAPSRGMTLKITPPVSASPRPPDVVITTSCAPATCGMFPPPPPLPAQPMLMPSA